MAGSSTGGRSWRLVALTLLTLFVRGASAEAPLPTWPPVFTSKYTSDWMQTHGTFWVSVPVDGSTASQRIDLADGTRDHLCSTFHNSTPCTQLTTEGFRYLYFPQVPDCCRCCSYATGPYLCGGPLGPKWLSNATGNLSYKGVESVRGRRCDKWGIQGLSSNYYFQFVDSKLPCQIDSYNYLRTPEQRADNQYIFEPGTFADRIPVSTFSVPEMCVGSRFCGPPVCDLRPELV
mmetsp:Transcript_36078/g.102136  ORF Transcript_36078/g.102136 Transcript_36078/m.102136 type:complete len:233 (-) Transcript_36078:116-814(-)